MASSRSRTGIPQVDAAVDALVAAARPQQNEDLYRELLTTAAKMMSDGVARGDLKIASGALRELRNAFMTFEPHAQRRKVTVFGSARIGPDEDSYRQAQQLGAALADAGWMIISGGGPGIMTAIIEGAGRENSFAVTIRLPFEQVPPHSLVDHSHLVRFRYFFTRKLTFMNEASAYALFPGGFGTLDETFELFTLIQTGKETPAPIVLIDPPGETYWHAITELIRTELVAAGLVSVNDLELFHLTSSVTEAVAYIDAFFANYHSMRWVDGQLVIRMERELTGEALERLNQEFGDIVSKPIIATEPLEAEITDDDELGRPRLLLAFDSRQFSRLHRLVRRIGELT